MAFAQKAIHSFMRWCDRLCVTGHEIIAALLIGAQTARKIGRYFWVGQFCLSAGHHPHPRHASIGNGRKLNHIVKDNDVRLQLIYQLFQWFLGANSRIDNRIPGRANIVFDLIKGRLLKCIPMLVDEIGPVDFRLFARGDKVVFGKAIF